MLTPEIADAARRSVLCWLATVDAAGQPNVSPKEIFAVFDAGHLVIANIASPTSVRNVGKQAPVCISFIDVFVQKGYKILGAACHVAKGDAEFAHWSAPLVAMAGPRFPLHGVIVVQVTKVEPIVAPSYRLYPGETSEAAQVVSAHRTYGVEPSSSPIRTLVERHWALANARQWDAFSELLAEDLRYDVPQTREYIDGRVGYVELFRTWPGDWRGVILHLACDATSATCTIAFEVDGTAATGISRFDIADGRVARVTDWWPEPYEPPPRATPWFKRAPP